MASVKNTINAQARHQQEGLWGTTTLESPQSRVCGLPSFHCGTLRNPISVMLSEHDAVGDLLAKLRQMTNGYTPPADGCATYVSCFTAMTEIEADTHLHIYKENNVLFPLVVRLEAERTVMVGR